jgi:hypothetical protein
MFSTRSIDSVTLETFDPGVPFAKTVFGAWARHPQSPAEATLDRAEASRRSVSGLAWTLRRRREAARRRAHTSSSAL